MKFIFIGLLLTNLDLNLNLPNFSIDVLPDIIGWILILLGCAKMAQYSGKFRTSELIAAVMTVVSLAAIFIGAVDAGLISRISGIIAGVGDLAFCWFVTKAISDTEDKFRTDLGYMELYRVLSIKIVTFVLSAILQFIPYLGVVFIIAHIVVCLIFIYRIFTVMKAFQKHLEAETE